MTQQESPTLDEVAPDALRQTLLALTVLDAQRTALDTGLKAERKKWADALSATTERLNDQLRDPIPGPAGECKKRLQEIQDIDKERQAEKSEKSTAIATLQAMIAEVEQAFYDILRRQKNPSQMDFDFQGSGAHFDPRAGIVVDQKHVETVRRAAENFAAGAESEVEGLAELNSRLEQVGAVGLEFPDVGGDDDDDDDRDPEPNVGGVPDDDGDLPVDHRLEDA